MIVYGDHELELELGDLLAGMRRRFERRVSSLDEVRACLIAAGQLEQAAADAGLACSAPCAALTRHIAEILNDRRRGSRPFSRDKGLQAALSAIGKPSAAHTQLHLRTPEGFAYYGLLPEAYAQAAEAWAGDSAPTSVLVIGLRSIGTTLAAVVAASLDRDGCRSTAITVRPAGHPFGRRTELPADLPSATHVIVVDEGPGLSGSSMASVARALIARGWTRERMTFFPGHPHGPGALADDEARGWWQSVASRTVAWQDLQLKPHSRLIDVLGQEASRLLGEPLQGPLQDIGGGRWRDIVGSTEVPSLAPGLEAPKLLARGTSGRGLLLKFSGLSIADAQVRPVIASRCERHAERLGRLADAGLSPPALTIAHGWIVMPWIEGRRLTPADTSQAMLARIARQIAAAAQPRLDAAEASRAAQRLVQLLVANTEALLGCAAADRARRVSDTLRAPLVALDLPAYGDGRLAPCEWIETKDGVILKADAAGHADDHTAIGPQPIAWDIAGAIVEWRLDADAARCLVGLTGQRVAEPLVAYFSAAYAAFRAAVADLSCAAASDCTLAGELAAARASYAARLNRELTRLDALLPAAQSL